jgi:hypothetical protein
VRKGAQIVDPDTHQALRLCPPHNPVLEDARKKRRKYRDDLESHIRLSRS